MISHLLLAALRKSLVGVTIANGSDRGAVTEARENLKLIRDSLPRLQNFDFGILESATIADQGWRGVELFGQRKVRLPFDECCFEHRWHDTDGSENTSLYIAVQGASVPENLDIVVTEFRCSPSRRPLAAGVPVELRHVWIWTGLIVGVAFTSSPGVDVVYLADYPGFGRNGSEELDRQTISMFSPVCLMAALLAMPSSSTRTRQAPKFINREREKKGKPPLFSHHLVTIGAEGYRELEREVETIPPASRLSPRLHLRRGHIRHLRSGKEIWIRSCTVGTEEQGTVSHDYRYVAGDRSAA